MGVGCCDEAKPINPKQGGMVEVEIKSRPDCSGGLETFTVPRAGPVCPMICIGLDTDTGDRGQLCLWYSTALTIMSRLDSISDYGGVVVVMLLGCRVGFCFGN